MPWRFPTRLSVSAGLCAFERGFALFDEGANAFREIGLGGALRERLGLALKLRLERMVVRALQQRLGAAVAAGRPRRQSRRELRGRRLELGGGHHLVDEA